MADNISSKKYYILFTIYFLGFGVVVSLLSSFINYRVSFTNIDKELIGISKAELIIKREYLSSFISDNEKLLSSVVRNDLMLDFLGDSKYIDNATDLLYALSYSHSDIMQLRYIDEFGVERIRIERDKKSPSLIIVPESQLQDKSSRYYFKEGSILLPNQFWHSNIDLNIEHGEIELPIKPTFRISTPVVRENKFRGIVILNIHFSDVIRYLTTSTSFYVYITDKEGEILHSPVENQGWSRYLDNSLNLYNIFPDDAEYILKRENYNRKGLYSYSVSDLFLSDEGIRMIFIPKSNVLNSMKSNNRLSAFLLAVTILIISVPLSWLISIIPSSLQSKLANAYDEIKRKSEIIDKNVMISKTALSGIISDVSSSFLEITGYARSEVLGKSHNILRHPDTPPEVYLDMYRTITSGNIWEGDIKDLSKKGEAFWVHMVITPELDEDGNVDAYIGIAQDITDKKTIEKMSITDTLTGLFNRRSLEATLNHEIAMFERYRNVFSLILFDIDHFKKVNDTFGHQTGDDVLVKIAEIIKGNARETDYVCRWGGEEFIIIVSGLDSNGAFEFAQKLRSLVEEYSFPEVGTVTISCGVVQFKSNESSHEFTSRADIALYKAKKAGRNTVVIGD